MKKIIDQINNEIKQYRINDRARLMAVSKTHPYTAVLEAYQFGERLFGENKVQEVLAKFPPKEERPKDMQVHLIGHLQSNKVQKIVGAVDSIDSVDSLKLAQKISRVAEEKGIIVPVLLEYNTSGDENKTGFDSYADILSVCQKASSLPGIRIDGLMTIGPLGGDEEEVKQAFEKLVALQKDLCRDTSLSLDELSMGMSGDYKIALACGSTMVRVGTKIFGKRDYPLKDNARD